ncbi:ATP-binding protein [Streptomyces sp. NPDC058439]|uniref:ATP-binding protein n=1 Tax=Streptomyces sp. NPDC058439 TaxID=3346500 RepID=UPI003647A867
MSQSSSEDKTPAREIIVEYAQQHFHYFRTPEGTPYAQRFGHPVARPMKSQGVGGSHRQELMLDMFNEDLGLFSGTAMKEALDLIEALTMNGTVRPVHIRVAPCGKTPGVTWLDLGRDDGQSVRIAPRAWEVRKPMSDEVTWRRTQLTGELPMPEKDQHLKGIDKLLGLCNFADPTSESLAIAWLLGCLDPAVPVPAPFLTGPQGAGKSTAGRMLTRVIEGMSADLRRAPKDEESMITAVAAGWITPLDNLSHLSADMSDLMCCIVTGAETLKRALFTDGDVYRARYRRPLLLTGIDVGVIRPDLGERLLHLKLIRPKIRRSEAELWAEYEEALPSILGGLLDLAVEVRAQEAGVPADLRMADFARLCAQFDDVHQLGALNAYRASLDDLTDDVIEGDPLAQLVLRYSVSEQMGNGSMSMSSSEWLDKLNRFAFGDYPSPPKGWPTTGKVLSDRLKRLQPTLAARSVSIEWGREKKGRYIVITRTTAPMPEQRSPEAEQTELQDVG